MNTHKGDRYFSAFKVKQFGTYAFLSNVENLGRVVGNIYKPDFINWKKAKTKGIHVYSEGP
jgi:hypothetical protein